MVWQFSRRFNSHSIMDTVLLNPLSAIETVCRQIFLPAEGFTAIFIVTAAYS